MATFSLDISAIVLAFGLCLYLRYRERGARAGLPLPPGPRKLPIIGNLLDIPKSFEWITYHRWSQELGSNILHLDIAGQSVIVLDDIEAVSDLLHKRSAIYSGRARMPMVNELMGWDFHVAWMPYGQFLSTKIPPFDADVRFHLVRR
ncbi:hypothetical protein H0H93_011572 [Arthromyces matolae]|nr:hypothetical protein H0H93_011572 [Arthromyces matolae]